jgi:rubrerythrin
MEFQTIRELLQFAITKEQASQRFYTDMARQVKDIAAQKIFETISKQEEQHEEALKLEVLKQGYTLAEGPQAAESAEFEWQEELDLDRESVSMSYTDALMMAIQKERAAFQLYTQLISMTQEPQMRKMLLGLAEEEMRHVIQFEREYDAVSH